MSSQDYRREVAKRRIMGNFKDEATNASTDASVDGSNPDHVRLLIEDLETKFQQHLELLNADLFSLKKEQEQAHSTGMMKLSKSIRDMKIRDFNQAYSCDLLSLLKSKDGVQKVSGQILKKRERFPVVETPAPNKFRAKQPPGTILRTVRRGETI